jgi:hypothetical protein
VPPMVPCKIHLSAHLPYSIQATALHQPSFDSPSHTFPDVPCHS